MPTSTPAPLRGVAVVCQKPLAPTEEESAAVVAAARSGGSHTSALTRGC